MDVASFSSVHSNIYIALSIYAHRLHSIYLTSLSNLRQLRNEQRKLIFDSSYGTITDYCFPLEEILFNDYTTHSKCHLYVLFDRNILLQVDIIPIILCNKTELCVKSDVNIQEINNILATREFNFIDYINNDVQSEVIMFKQLFKNCRYSENNSCFKRKNEEIQEQQSKK